jgi:hypothetical protein
MTERNVLVCTFARDTRGRKADFCRVELPSLGVAVVVQRVMSSIGKRSEVYRRRPRGA